jgi:hypothetical protein
MDTGADNSHWVLEYGAIASRLPELRSQMLAPRPARFDLPVPDDLSSHRRYWPYHSH